MVLLIRLVVAVTLLSGCFSPALDGKFQCGAGGSCPSGLHCAADDVCRDDASDAALAADLAMPRDLAPVCVKKTCGATECGNALDGCGGMVSCGGCMGPLHCGGNGPNMCGVTMCMPLNCQQRGATCGLISNNCDNVMNCGNCMNGQTCGSNNQCS